MAKRPISPTNPKYIYSFTNNKYLKIDDPEAVIRIETDCDYCETTYPTEAVILFEQLRDLLPEYKLQVEIVEGIRGSFEVYCRKANGTGKGIPVWSGFDKLPWKEKIPEAKTLVQVIREILK